MINTIFVVIVFSGTTKIVAYRGFTSARYSRHAADGGVGRTYYLIIRTHPISSASHVAPIHQFIAVRCLFHFRFGLAGRNIKRKNIF